MDDRHHPLNDYTAVVKALELLREVPARDDASAQRGRERFLQEARALKKSAAA